MGEEKPKVLNKRMGSATYDAVYVGRPSQWGNPFRIGPDGDRDEVIEKFEDFVERRPWLRRRARRELRGKDLVCWCAPEPCHADVLLRIANE